MSTELATLFEWNRDLWLPIADIAKAWGIDRSTPDNMINRNMEVFGDVTRTVLDDMSTPMQCINERGLYLMMGKISASRLKDPAAKAAIIRFQRWFPELIQRYRKKEIVQVSSGPSLETEILHARQIAERCGKNPDAFLAIALDRAWGTRLVQHHAAGHALQRPAPEPGAAQSVSEESRFPVPG